MWRLRAPSLPAMTSLFALLILAPAAFAAWTQMEFLAETASVAAIAVAPTQPARLYAASQNGMHRTDDQGVNWTPIPIAGGGSVQAIAVSPASADNVWVLSGTIFRSMDAGASWTPSADAIPNGESLLVDAYNPSHLYAVSSSNSAGGIYKSTDSGDTWANVWGVDRAFDLAAHSTTPNTVVAATDAGLARTTDAGITWAIWNPLVAARSVEWTPSDAARVYFREPGYAGQVFQSTDAGATFAPTTGNFLSDTLLETLVADPLDPDHLVSAGTGYGCSFNASIQYHWKTSDAGASWSQQWQDPTCGYSPPSELVFDPTDSDRLFLAEFGAPGSGTGFRTSSDGGSSFSPASLGMGSYTASGRLRGSSGVTYVFFGKDKYRTTDFVSFTPMATLMNGVDQIQVSPHDPNVVLEGGWGPSGDIVYSYLQRSSDGMASWSPWPSLLPGGIPSNLGRPSAFMNPAAGTGIYAVVNQTLYRSTDAGTTFGALGAIQGDAEIVVGPAASRLFSADATNSVQLSEDAGISFTPRNTGLPSGWPRSLFMSSSNGNFLVTLYSTGEVYETTDSGLNWTLRTTLALSAPFTFVQDVAWDETSGHVYVATNKGLLTADGRVVTDGLPSTNIQSVHYDPSTTILQVAVHGHGMFWETLGTAVEAPEVAASVRTLHAAPNPFAQRTSLVFQVPRGGAEVTLEILDVAGRRIRMLRESAFAAGLQSIAWNGKDAFGKPQAPGIYFARLVVNGDVSVTKVVRVD